MISLDNKYVQNLIEASKRGNKNSFMQLCEINVGNIYTLCLRVFVDPEKALQVTKHIFLLAWKNIKQIRNNTSFNLWLHGFAVNIILEYLRARLYSRQEEKKIFSDTHVVDGYDLGRKILELDDVERVIFILHDVIKYSYNELADFINEISLENMREININARMKLLEGVSF